MSMDRIIIKACLNGGRGREDNPDVPWTPEEVAQRQCAVLTPALA